MAERYFKKSKDKFKVGYSSKVFKYDFTRHKIDDLENRFIECDVDGNAIKAKPKSKPKKKKAEVDNGNKD